MPLRPKVKVIGSGRLGQKITKKKLVDKRTSRSKKSFAKKAGFLGTGLMSAAG